MCVGEGDGLRRAGKHRRDVDPAFGQQGRAKGHPVGGIVVARDGEHRQLPAGKLGEEPVQQADCLGRRHGFVVQVTGQQHGIHGVGIEQG